MSKYWAPRSGPRTDAPESHVKQYNNNTNNVNLYMTPKSKKSQGVLMQWTATATSSAHKGRI